MKWRIVSAAVALAVFASAWVGHGDERPIRGRELRSPDRLKVGDPAPDFELKTLDGKQTVRLSSFRGKRPVALIFGSYT